MRDALEKWIAEQRGIASAVVELRRITTGHSRANWYLELADGERYVVRIEQGGVFGTSGADEFEFMRAAARLGCPVARVRWIDTSGEVIGHPFFVMDFVVGAPPAREERALSSDLAEDFVRHLADLHNRDWTQELAIDGDAAGITHSQIDRWTAVYRNSSPIADPLLEEARTWLHHNALAIARPSIVHGDPGPGNFVHDGQRVLALTDWEFAHIGDPTEDWAYLISMRGSRTMPREAWLALIDRVATVTLTDRDLRYWGAFNFFKGACANLSCIRAFAGPNPAPNMAMIGTVLQQTFTSQLASLVAGDSP